MFVCLLQDGKFVSVPMKMILSFKDEREKQENKCFVATPAV